MVVTRSRLDTHKKPTKKKFDDEYELENFPNVEEISHQESDNRDEPENSDSGSDSDDAPEEESTSLSKKAIIEKQKQEQLRLQKAKEEVKESRRQLDLKNKQQKELKKKRELEKKSDESEELPEFLPEDIFSTLNNEESTNFQGRHLNAQELDERSAKLARQKLKEEKLRRIKESKNISVKKGPIHVQVQSFDINKKIVPRAESRVIDTKELWLSRKSLNKR